MPHYLVLRILLITLLIAPFFGGLHFSIFPLASLTIFITFYFKKRVKKKKLASLILLCQVVAIASITLHSSAMPTPLQTFSKKNQKIVGIVNKVFTKKSGQAAFLTTCHNSKCEKIYLVLPRGSPLEINDKVTFIANLQIVSKGSGFNEYLRRHGISYIAEFPNIQKIVKRPSLKKALYLSKKYIENVISKNTPYPQSSLLIGLITGSRNSLPEKVSEDFKKLGLTHILAISGYNITIIINLLDRLLPFVHRQKRFILIGIGITLFTIFVGADPPVLRAAIMGIIGLVALRFGHKSNITNALLLSASAMYIFDPLIINDVSFQLSFAATFGVIYISPFIQDKLEKIPNYAGLRENLSLTLAAQITTAPVSIYHFNSFSLLAPLSNIVVLPLIPLCMMLGAIALPLSIVFSNFSELLFAPSYLLLSITIKAVELMAKIPIKLLSF